MPFPEFSVNRSAFEGQPADVLIPPPQNPNRDAYREYGVLMLQVSSVRSSGLDGYDMDVEHRPEEWNYHHCDVTCKRGDALQEPNKTTRKLIRYKLWRASEAVVIPATSSSAGESPTALLSSPTP